jgi:AcrR family transcriptional regulator
MPKVVPEYKEEAKRKIISMAQEAFSEGRYDRTTMEDIGHRLGVSRGSSICASKIRKNFLKPL